MNFVRPIPVSEAPGDRVGAPGYLLGALTLFAVLAAILGFRGGLAELFHRWTTQEEYSHGFIIPFVTLWFLWSRRDAIISNIGRPSWLGAGLTVLAIGMLIIGELSAVFILSQLGFVVTLFGIAFAVGGFSLLRIVFVPIAFLLFAIPLPYFIDAMLTLRLQLISSELGVWLIRLFNIPVYLDGNIIDLGTYKLQVVDACSGLRYLYPLLSLSFLAAYLFHGPLWQRVVVFLSSIPIAIGMNGLRIGLVGILVANLGKPDGRGGTSPLRGVGDLFGVLGSLSTRDFCLCSFSPESHSSTSFISRICPDTGPRSLALG